MAQLVKNPPAMWTWVQNWVPSWAGKIPWRRERLPIPVFGPGEFHGLYMVNRWGNSGNSVRLYFGGAPKSLQMVIAAMKLKDAYSLEGKL